MGINFHLHIVSAEAEIFKGLVQKVFVSGVKGDMEVLFGHAPLLTSLLPSPVWIITANGKEEVFYISGGMLEVQPEVTTILADTALRAKDVDEAAALEAKKRAEAVLSSHTSGFNYAQAQSELLEAIAQLRTLKRLREKK